MSTSMGEKVRRLAWVAAPVVIAAILLALGGKLYLGFEFKDKLLTEATEVVTGLLVTTLLVERSIAVVNTLIWGEKERNLKRSVLTNGAKPQVVPAEEDKLARLVSLEERVRLILGFAAGLFVSLAGVRTLEGILTIPSAAEETQEAFAILKVWAKPLLDAGGANAEAAKTALAALDARLVEPGTVQLFHTVDVLLTAGIIAGGSHGLAILLQALKGLVKDGAGESQKTKLM